MSTKSKMYVCFVMCAFYHVGISIVMFWIYMLFPESLGGGGTAQFRVILVGVSSLAVCWFAVHCWVKAHPEYVPDIMNSVIFGYAKRQGLPPAHDEKALDLLYKKIKEVHRRNSSTFQFVVFLPAPLGMWAAFSNAEYFFDFFSIAMHFVCNFGTPLIVCYSVILKSVDKQDETAWEKAWGQIIKDHKKGGAA